MSAPGRNARGHFAKGNSGGPGRRPSPWREIVKRSCDPEKLARIFAALAQEAEHGNVEAARLALSYAIGRPREASGCVPLDLPKITSTAQLPAMLAAIFEGLRTGTIDASEAAALVTVGERAATLFEHADLESRIRALEDRR